jgi:hypothetical protein
MLCREIFLYKTLHVTVVVITTLCDNFYICRISLCQFKFATIFGYRWKTFDAAVQYIISRLSFEHCITPNS